MTKGSGIVIITENVFNDIIEDGIWVCIIFTLRIILIIETNIINNK